MATLKDVKVGESATVARLTGVGALKRRIMDMGLTKGTRVYVRKVAPLGDPLELTVRGYELYPQGRGGERRGHGRGAGRVADERARVAGTAGSGRFSRPNS